MKKIIIYLIVVISIISILALIINYFVILNTKNKIISEEKAKNISDVDCILILGAGIWGDKPSTMLEDRLLQGSYLYKNNISTKIIVSGDHGKEDYDEVNIMKKYLIEQGIKSQDIFMDHAGFSSYDSIYRAKEVFQSKKIIIVTQKYHLYRALYIAKQLEIEAYGIPSDPREYSGQSFREIREIIARDKDFIKCIFKPEPTCLGNTIQVNGDGDITNDKKQM